MASLVAKQAANNDDSDEEHVQVDVEEVENEPEEDTTLANSDVLTKYQEAARIANEVLREMMALCVPGAKVLELCTIGDAKIDEKCNLVFKAKVKGRAVEKGVAFPVCISINECVCNVSPLTSEGTGAHLEIANGDIVKIDLGVHISGYIAVAANSIVVGAVAAAEAPVTGLKANVFHAAQSMSKVIAATIKAGNTNKMVVDACKKVLSAYPGVNCLEGVTMHQMKRYIIDGNKTIIIRPSDESAKVEEVKFEENEVYAVDVCVSSGEGTPKEGNARTTVFKRQVDKTYQLKMAASRKVFNEINKRFPTMPFTMRSLEDEKTAKLGIRECVLHDLLTSYQVVFEKPGDHVVHVRFTLLLLPSGTVKVTGFNCTPEVDGATIFGAPADLAAIDAELAAIVSAPEAVKLSKKARKAAAAKA